MKLSTGEESQEPGKYIYSSKLIQEKKETNEIDSDKKRKEKQYNDKVYIESASLV